MHRMCCSLGLLPDCYLSVMCHKVGGLHDTRSACLVKTHAAKHWTLSC